MKRMKLKKLIVMMSWATCLASPTSSLIFWIRGRSSMRLRRIGRSAADPSSARTSSWRSVTWVMVAGPITTSRQKSRRGSIAPQKSLLAQSMGQVLIYGRSRAWFSKWPRVTSSSNHARVRSMGRTTIIWPRWWSCLEGCLSQWLTQGSALASTSTQQAT